MNEPVDLRAVMGRNAFKTNSSILIIKLLENSCFIKLSRDVLDVMHGAHMHVCDETSANTLEPSMLREPERFLFLIFMKSVIDCDCVCGNHVK